MKVPKSFLKYHALYGSEITEFFKLNNINGGVMSRDGDMIKGDSIIINLDDEDSTGTHWTALKIIGDSAWYFDPFGVQPPEEIVKYLKGKNLKIFYSDSPIQPNTSILCGYYSVLFLYWMNTKPDMYEFIYQFKQDGESANDKLLKNIIESSEILDNKKGAGFDLVDKLSNDLGLAGQEWHLRSIGRNEEGNITITKHNWTGPLSDNEKKIANWEQLRQTPWEEVQDNNVILTDDKYKGINDVDQNAMLHDIAYDLIHRQYEEKDRLEQIHKADKILEESTIKIMKDSDQNISTRVEAGFVTLVMKLKQKLGLGKAKNNELNEVLDFIKRYQEYLPEKTQAEIVGLLTQD